MSSVDRAIGRIIQSCSLLTAKHTSLLEADTKSAHNVENRVPGSVEIGDMVCPGQVGKTGVEPVETGTEWRKKIHRVYS